MMKRFSIVLATLSVIAMAKAQNVGIGTVLPHPSAALELNSNSQGLLVPRLTKTEKSAIAAPATGLMVYQTGPDSSGFHYYNGTAWVWINPQTASGGGSFPATGIVLSETANNSALSGAGFSYSGLLRLPGATLEQTGPAGANTWLSTNAVSGPPPATGHQALYSDSSFYVWGGNMGFNNPGIGVYRYNPITDRWTNLNPSGTTSSTGPAYGSASVKAGNKWVHWGGYTYPGGTGLPAVVYDFGTNAITYSSSAPFSVGLAGVASVGIGNKAYFWGGYYLTNFSIRVNLGFVYDVATNTWQSMSTSEAPQERAFAGMVHTGTKLIVWGGNTANGNTNTGGVYTIATNSWEPMGIGNAPAATIDPIMVWRSPFLYVISGNMAKRYDPTTYQWTNLATAPTVFSGNKFTYDDNGKIYIWGGTRVYNSPSPTANGYVYDLDSNTFTALPATGAPEARGDHTLTFGNNMLLVWGGTSSNTSSSPTVAQSFNSGGRYVLAPTTVTNAAPAALWHLFKKQ